MESIFLYLFGIVLLGILTGFYFGMVLTPRKPSMHCWFSVLIFTVMLFPSAIIKSFAESDFLQFILSFFQLALILLLCSCYSSDTMWRKVLSVLNFAVTIFISEMSAMAVIHNFGISIPVSNDEYILFHIFNDLFVLIYSSISIILWRALIKKRIIHVRYIWLFPLFPISQLLSYFSNWYHARKVIGVFYGNPLSCFSTFLGFLANMFLLYILIMQSEREILESKLHQFQMLQSVEETHYHTLMERQHEISKLQHDYKNQLSAALRLLTNQQTEQSEELLMQIKESLSSSQNPFCSNLVINAVLEEKSSIAAKSGIKLTIECCLPEQINIPSYHLCSAYSNLLDNALRAASLCDEKERLITLKSGICDKHLIIKLKNSTLSAKSPSLRGHGYGNLILEDLAKQYCGDFYTDFANGVYTAILTLELPDAI